MRECLRCNTEMVDNLLACAGATDLRLAIMNFGIIKKYSERPKAAVCPKCGYVELYMEEPAKVLKLRK